MSIASQRKKHEEERKRRQQQATPMPAEQHQVVESAAAPEPIPPQFDFARQALEAAFREHDDEEKQKEKEKEREAAEHIHREQAASHAKHQADDQQQRMDAMRAADAQASQMRRESFAAKDFEQRRPSLSRSDREAPTSRVEPDRGEVGDLRGVHAYSTGTERLGRSASMTDFVPERDKAGAGTEHVNPAAWKDHINQSAQAAEQGGLVISGEPIKPAPAAQPKAEIQAGSKAAVPAPAQEATSSPSVQRVAERFHADATPAAQPLQAETQAKPVLQAEAGQVAEHVATAAPIGPQAQADSKAAVPAPAAQAATSSAQRVAERVHADPAPAAQPQAETQARPVPQAEKAGQVVEHVTTAALAEPQAQAGSKAAAPAQETTSSLSAQRVAERFRADPTPAVQPQPKAEIQAKPVPQAEKASEVVEHVTTAAPAEPQAQAGSKAAVPAQEATSSLSAQRVAERFRADDEPAKELPKTEARKVDLDDEAEHAQDQEGGEGGEGQGNAQQEPTMDGQDQQDPAKQQGSELDDYADDYGL